MVVIYLESWYVGACRALPGQILFSNYIMWPQSEIINELPWTRRLQTSPSRCYPFPFQKAVNFWMIYSGAVRLFIFGCNYFATKSCCYIKYCIYPSVVTCKYCIYPSVVTCFQQFSELPILVIVSQRHLHLQSNIVQDNADWVAIISDKRLQRLTPLGLKYQRP